jgi:hypothetical protein
MPQLNEALVDTTIGTIFCQLWSEDAATILDQNDDSLVIYHNIAQLQ